VPYEEARPIQRGIGKYSRPEEETRIKSGRQDTGRQYIPRKPVTVGWEPDLPAIRRGIVLDPFCGSGSTGEVALKLGRNFIGIELYSEYAEIAEERCRLAHHIYEEKKPTTPSTAAFVRPVKQWVPDEVNCDLHSGNHRTGKPGVNIP
jgi:hypothetical protein